MAKHTAVIVLLLLFAVSSVYFSFEIGMPIIRRLGAYPICGLVNMLLIATGVRAWYGTKGVVPRRMEELLFFSLGWGGLLIIRSLDVDPGRIRDLFFTHWGAMSYLIPFAAFLGVRARFWLAFLRFGAYLTAVGIVVVSGYIGLALLGYELSEYGVPVSHNILFVSPLLYLAGISLNKRYMYLGAFGLFVWLAFSFLVDKREMMVLIAWYLFCALFELRRSSVVGARDKGCLLLALGFLALVWLHVDMNRKAQAFAVGPIDRRLTEFFHERGALENTREGLVRDLFLHMTFTDVIFGRGAVTTYETDIHGLAQSHLTGRVRQHVEIGHLYHMLTGGIIQNILFCSLSLGAIFLGLRRSQNRFTRSLVYIVAGWVLLMVPAAIPFGGLRYFLVWLAIGGCWSIEMRSVAGRLSVPLAIVPQCCANTPKLDTNGRRGRKFKMDSC